MRWRFWRRDEEPARDLPGDVGLQWQPGVGPVHSAAREDEEDRGDARAPAFSGASPQPGAVDPLSPGGLPPLEPPEHEVDGAFARTTADALVALVTTLVAGDRSGAASARGALQAELAAATDDQQGLAVIVALVPLSERLPELAGVADADPDDATARAELLAYAPLLAARADGLRTRFAPDLSPDALRFAALFACGAPDADPALEHLFASPPVDQVTACALLLAQTCADGAAGPQELRAEIAEAYPPAA